MHTRNPDISGDRNAEEATEAADTTNIVGRRVYCGFTMEEMDPDEGCPYGYKGPNTFEYIGKNDLEAAGEVIKGRLSNFLCRHVIEKEELVEAKEGILGA